MSVWAIFVVIAMTLGLSASSSNAYKDWHAQKDGPCTQWEWETNEWVPEVIEKPIEIAARTRAGIICNNYGAASNVDQDQIPNNFSMVVRYMPRAIEIAIFGPFPDMWFNPPSITRMVGTIETLIWYLLAPGIAFALYYNRSIGIIVCISFALTYLAIYGFTISNLGTLHRVRYPFLMLFMMIGLLGWVHVVLKNKWFVLKRAKKSDSKCIKDSKDVVFTAANSNLSDLRRKVAKGGGLVAMLTLISYAGFFFRDVLMAHSFGIGDQLDAFFIAMLLPMFFVNVFCQSFGSHFLHLHTA